MMKKPELLSPAGTPEAFYAALDAGADAVYMGVSSFNARMGAANFDDAAFAEAVKTAHALGAKVYVTLNTLLADRELSAFSEVAAAVYRAGADAAIVADLGAASLIHRLVPGLSLHASTQASGHNALAAHTLQRCGFERMVVAREISFDDLAVLMKESPLETELFVHGALCVSHSGQCLFSSLVGGRSGNRGLCAQPCRLPYGAGCAGCRASNDYPLSLKDLCLARYIPEITALGVASLKIEGRMKSPEYVYGVTSIYRRLLDENRPATDGELQKLASLFSRGGFTDGYQEKKIGSAMLGVRSESDKEKTRTAASLPAFHRKAPVRLTASVKIGEPITLTLSGKTKTVTVSGESGRPALNAPLSAETVHRQLTKFGSTPLEPIETTLTLDRGVMVPISSLNALRRAAVDAFVATGRPDFVLPSSPQERERERPSGKPFFDARFYSPAQITPEAEAFFDRLYLPLPAYIAALDGAKPLPNPEKLGVILPPVLFERDIATVRAWLQRAKENGVCHALVANIGHLPLALEAGMVPHGDFRLNVTNRESLETYLSLGFADVLLSPEMTLPRLRDIGKCRRAVVYGRLPLMLLEKCVAKEVANCTVCASGKASLRDRRGVVFPILREWEHRNVVCNSALTYMLDQPDKLTSSGITSRHFLFTTESAGEVNRIIAASRSSSPCPLDSPIRRLGTEW